MAASFEVNLWHEYYQLPLIPAAAVYFGIAAGPFFDGRWTLMEGKGLARGLVLVLAAVLALRPSPACAMMPVFRRVDSDRRDVG